jgi:hypothetical protein
VARDLADHRALAGPRRLRRDVAIHDERGGASSLEHGLGDLRHLLHVLAGDVDDRRVAIRHVDEDPVAVPQGLDERVGDLSDLLLAEDLGSPGERAAGVDGAGHRA